MIQMIIQQWLSTTKNLRLEAQLRVEYADRLKDLEDNLAKWKTGQATATQNVVIRQIQQEQQALMGRTFDCWRKDVEDAAFMKENGDRVQALEAKLANVKQAQKENATKVLSGMASASEKGFCAQVFKSWVQVRMDSIKTKQHQEARLADESKLEQFTKGKSDEAKYLVQSFAGANNTGLMHSVVTAWIKLYDENKQEQ